MNLNKLISELRRRNVFKVATAYAIVGWLIIQVVVAITGPLGLPEWVPAFFIIFVAVGFPIALIVAWAFELTPEGLKKTKEIDKTTSIAPSTGKRINRLIIGALSVLILFLLAERVFFAKSTINDTETQVLKASVLDKSIAVLPFDDFNAGGEQEYFADGLTEEILNALAKTPDLQVASRTSSFQFKDRNIDARSIADTLGVAHILEGSVRQSSEKIRITAQLIRASDGFHLWSETYDQSRDDIIQVQEDIAFKIASALETVMDPEELEQMIEAGTQSVEAYQVYLKGKAARINSRLPEANNYFEEAIKLDPQFAEAYYESALLYQSELTPVVLNYGFLDLNYDEKLGLFNDRISNAIKFSDPVTRKSYEANKAFVNLEFRKTLSILNDFLNDRPNDEDALKLAILTSSHLHEREMSLDFNNRLEEIMLKNEENYTAVVANYFWAGEYEGGAKFARTALEKFPYSNELIYQSHRVFLWAGQTEEAADLLERLSKETIGERAVAMAKLRQACAEGNRELAEQIYSSGMISPNIGSQWIALRFLGRDEDAYNLIRPLDESNQLFSLATWLHYPYFDYHMFPNLEKVLAREKHRDLPVQKIQFALQ
ncbi:hypothetical protein [Fulvivirga sedimenti]|uniref:FlgO domain-containing protein n=1 Tax=Fulvivirga sedimenti TaxID=2879465 RepID=A0A9X1L2G0_9BACT|nr:hypothetical protein [Fulvivirga sedimenti]MCA6079232.1 hypothetical protein [Fulvivirga sedimenti]